LVCNSDDFLYIRWFECIWQAHIGDDGEARNRLCFAFGFVFTSMITTIPAGDF
jgi:hypothetical protein